MDAREGSDVATSEIFAAGGNVPKIFNAREESLDQIAVLVQIKRHTFSTFLRYPKISDRAMPLRASRHVPGSISTLRVAITRVLARACLSAHAAGKATDKHIFIDAER